MKYQQRKKISILTKLTSDQKLLSIATLIEEGKIIEDPETKSNLLNSHFSPINCSWL